MCYELSRRNIIVAAIGGLASGLGFSGVSKKFAMDVASDLFDRRRTLANLLAAVPKDKADSNPRYLKDTDMSHWHTEAHPFFEELKNKGHVPEQGLIVELGSYQGASLQALNELFGSHRVRGVDIYPYTNSRQIFIGDVRTSNVLQNFQAPALVWNDVSNWENSPRSKLAAFEWAKQNLVKGGVYVDDAMKNLPLDLDLSGFQLIYSKGYITAFRKT